MAVLLLHTLSRAFLGSTDTRAALPREPHLGWDHSWQHKHCCLFQSLPQTSCRCFQGFVPQHNRQPRPALLQLVVSKSSGVKKQEAMQRRERIQTEA